MVTILRYKKLEEIKNIHKNDDIASFLVSMKSQLQTDFNEIKEKTLNEYMQKRRGLLFLEKKKLNFLIGIKKFKMRS